MAIIDHKGRLHGKIGNIVYRTIGNTNIVQAKPYRVRQTLSTQESAMEFGLVSNCGRILRNMYASFSCYSDGRLLNRMNVALLRMLRDTLKPRGERDLHEGNPEHLKGLQFNMISPLTEVMPVRPVCTLLDGGIRVQLPPFKGAADLLLPKHTKNAVLRLMVAAINFRERYYEYLDYKDIHIAYGMAVPQQEWVSEVALPEGCMVLVTASLHCWGIKGIDGESLNLNGKEYGPAEIIGAYRIEDTVEIENKIRDESTAPNRHRLINYRGEDILQEIERKRKRNKGYQDKLKQEKTQTNTREVPLLEMVIPMTGKMFYKKE